MRRAKQQSRKVQPVRSGAEWFVPLALFAAAALVFSPAIQGQFVWDDEVAIRTNSFLASSDGLWKIWTAVGGIPGEEHYWPLTYTVLWFEWNLWGGNPAGFHVLNFILHGLIVVQIWRLARRIGVPGAAFGAALFALHPVHAEAVAWLISIKDLLATLLSLMCIEFFLNDQDQRNWKWLAWASIVTAAAMLCKSSPVTLAATVAVFAWYRHGRIGRRDWVWIAVLGAITISIGLADMWVVKQKAFAKALPAPDLIDRVLQSGWAFWLYVKHLAWPIGLGPVYPKYDLNAAWPLNWLPLASIVAVTAGLFLARNKMGRAPLACWLFYLVSLSPVIGVIYFAFLRISPGADRYQYWASIAPLLLAGAGIERMIQTGAQSRRFQRQCAAAALLAIIAILSWRQACCFTTTETFLRRAAEVTAPNSAYVKQLLGTEYLAQQKFELAETQFRESLRLDPKDWQTACNLGMALVRQERDRDAAGVYDEALNRGCDECALLSNYAWLLAMTGDSKLKNPKKAIELAKRSVQGPHAVDARYWQHLSLALEADGRIADALDAALKARRLAGEQKLDNVARELDESIAAYQTAIHKEAAP